VLDIMSILVRALHKAQPTEDAQGSLKEHRAWAETCVCLRFNLRVYLCVCSYVCLSVCMCVCVSVCVLSRLGVDVRRILFHHISYCGVHLPTATTES
jgi:hypothetical protein